LARVARGERYNVARFDLHSPDDAVISATLAPIQI
jgi:hypothetical protein